MAPRESRRQIGMRSVIPGLGPNYKYPIDFSLIPLGVILIEFSVLTTQLSKAKYESLSRLIELRFLHTVVMLILATVLSQVFIKLKKTELNYQTIALIGTLVIVIGEIINVYMASHFGVQLVSADRRIGIILLQGFLWFPAFVIVGGKRTEILHHFKAYEERLIIATRARSRKSDDFKAIQREIQDRIRQDLYSTCKSLRDSISEQNLDQKTLIEKNDLIQPLLVGDNLRKLSMKLETFGTEHISKKFFGQNINSINLLIRQFRILYATTSQLAPLSTRMYVFILMALVTPGYINYFNYVETLISYPLLTFAVWLGSLKITQTQSNKSVHALRTASILIFLTGLLPFFFNVIGQQITQNPRTEYPIFITAISLPFSYYVFMKFLQVMQPTALDLIKSDKLEASDALQNAVTKVVGNEFAHTLSHRWAIYIHGKILTRLAATALKLQTAANSGNTQIFEEGVKTLQALLSSPDSEFEQSPTDLQTEIESRLNPWQGLVDVKLEIEESLKEIKVPRVREIGEVIEELISNCMRHGKAQNIELKVARVGEKEIKISARDDASIGPSLAETRYGLGTKIFNLASDGRWSITRVASQTLFELTMGLEN